MSEVVRVVVVNDCAQPDPAVIDKLEELLRRAKSGEISGVAFVGIRAVGFGHYKPPIQWWGGAGVLNAVLATLGTIDLLRDDLICAAQEKTIDLPCLPEEPA